jgi:hypothetical protein
MRDNQSSAVGDLPDRQARIRLNFLAVQNKGYPIGHARSPILKLTLAQYSVSARRFNRQAKHVLRQTRRELMRNVPKEVIRSVAEISLSTRSRLD